MDDNKEEFPPWEPGEGWRVLDKDGNVVQSGPPVEVELVSGFGLPDPVEEK